jgi:predicted nucleic acid-binding protein
MCPLCNLQLFTSCGITLTVAVADYLTWEVVVNGGESILEAIGLEEQYRISFWDALVIEAAQRAGVDTLYSGDLSNGQMYGSVRVVNPLLP